jgi:hypothetical protein
LFSRASKRAKPPARRERITPVVIRGLLSRDVGEGECGGSVPAREFSQINGHPAVMGEVVELDLAKEDRRDGRGCKSPRVWITAELEAGNEKAKTDAWLGAGYQRELREGV